MSDNFTRKKKCPDCKGAGKLMGIRVENGKLRKGIVECKFCKGTGRA
jgi:DnaJ-class molecular chaperone